MLVLVMFIQKAKKKVIQQWKILSFSHSFITHNATRLIFQKHGPDHITQKTSVAPHCLLN